MRKTKNQMIDWILKFQEKILDNVFTCEEDIYTKSELRDWDRSEVSKVYFSWKRVIFRMPKSMRHGL